MLKHGECGNLSKPCELIHQCGQEDWFHLRDDIILFHGGVFAKQCLVLSELSIYERLFFGVPRALWVFTWVVRRHKHEYCLLPVLLVRHHQREVYVLASSEG